METPGDPTAGPIPATTRRPGRRWSRVVATVLVVLVMLPVLAVAAVDLAYESTTPIRRGAVFGAGPGSDDLCTPPGPLVCAHHPFAVGSVVVFGGEIRNAGPFPVTITGAPDDKTALVADKRLRLPREGTRYDARYTVPFEPLTLAPGEHRMIFEQRTLRCPPGGGSAGAGAIAYDVIRLPYRLLSVEHETSVPLLGQVVVDYPDPVACPPA